jgi:hypothetical protein
MVWHYCKGLLGLEDVCFVDVLQRRTTSAAAGEIIERQSNELQDLRSVVAKVHVLQQAGSLA